VPNALAADYAAAIGATGEPICCVGPFPDTLMAALREGWTLGEAFYLANPYDDWMWIVVGDPLLTLPEWFTYVPPATTIQQAASCMDHNGQELCMDLALAGAPTVEPREDGVGKIVLQTVDPVEVDSTLATVTCVNNAYTGVVTVEADGTTSVTIDLAPLPDVDCCEIALTGGIEDSFSVRTLRGDINCDGVTTTSDALVIKSRFGLDAATAGPMYDYNASGAVTTDDFLQVKMLFGNAAPTCP
jgi:hypothetical protein